MFSDWPLHLEADRTVPELDQLHPGAEALSYHPLICNQQHHTGAEAIAPLELISNRQHQHSAAAYKQINLVSINIIMFSFKTSDVVEKPWKKKKYEKTKSYSRQKLRKEDWMKKVSAKEDRVFRYLLMMMSLIKMMMVMMTAASLMMTGIWEGYSEKALSCRFNQNFPLFVSPPPIHWASLLVFGTR